MRFSFDPLPEGQAQYFEGAIDRAACGLPPSFSIDAGGRIVATGGDGGALVIELPPGQLLLLGLRAVQAAEAQGCTADEMGAALGASLATKGHA